MAILTPTERERGRLDNVTPSRATFLVTYKTFHRAAHEAATYAVPRLIQLSDVVTRMLQSPPPYRSARQRPGFGRFDANLTLRWTTWPCRSVTDLASNHSLPSVATSYVTYDGIHDSPFDGRGTYEVL